MARLGYYKNVLPNNGNTKKNSRALLYKNDENWSTGILNYNFKCKVTTTTTNSSVAAAAEVKLKQKMQKKTYQIVTHIHLYS